jgi:uncharacterized protein
MHTQTFRLKPGQDLWNEIDSFVGQNNIEAGVILCAVGSLTHATLRLANRDFFTDYEGHFEIVSITGAVSIHGSHIHISISDGDGQTIGGHLVPGCVVYTTAEIVIGVIDNVIYKREFAEDSGYDELAVYKK